MEQGSKQKPLYVLITIALLFFLGLGIHGIFIGEYPYGIGFTILFSVTLYLFFGEIKELSTKGHGKTKNRKKTKA